MPEILVITAADLEMEQRQAVHGRFEHALLSLIADMAKEKQPVVIRLDFPGEPHGGLNMQARRLGWLGRRLWWVGSRAIGWGA